MKFCKKCDSKLTETASGSKCPKCDELSQIQEKITSENEIGVLSNDSFPFEKNQYYKAPNIRSTLCCHKQHGINYNDDYNFLTILKHAHRDNLNPSNPYLDKYDEKSGNYYYSGKGTKGDQSLTRANEKLSNAKDSGTKIHLFWQSAINSDHKYIGEMEMQGYEEKTQLGSDGLPRKVYVFTLSPI